MGLGLSSAIHIAKMGMSAAEKSINISGTNLANANTIGYKAERPDFISFAEYLYQYGYEPGQANTEGTNPLQIGMGVELGSVTTDFSQGAFKEGMTNSDIAINGNGFIIAMYPNSSEMYFTRDGALKVNSNFDLTTNTGLNVMGYGVDDKFRIQSDKLIPLQIPIGEMHIAEQTNNIKIEGMLNALGDNSTQGTVLQTRPMTDLSKSFPDGQKLTAGQIPQPMTEGVSRATGSSAAGNVATGNYLYRCVYVDAAGNESDYSAPITAAVNANQNSVSLTDLPAVPAGYQSLRLYRATDPGDPTATAEFHQLVDLPASSNAYTDTASSESIVSNPYLQQGRLSQGSYRYYVSFIDAAGNESRPSLMSDAFNLNIGGQAELSNIPTVTENNPDNWTGRRIYRSNANDTSEFYLVGQIDNLDANATLHDRFSDAELTDGTHLEWSPAGRGNAMVTGETKLLDVGNFDGTLSGSNSNVRFIPVFEEGTLRFTPNKGGKELRVTELKITADTTVSDYLNFLSESFGIQNGSDIPADGGSIGKTLNGGKQGATVKDGQFYLLGNGGTDNALELDSNDLMLYNSLPDSPKQLGINWGQDPNNKQNAIGESKAVDLAVFDSLGAPVSVRLTFTLESKSNTETVYRWYADSSDNQPPEGQAIATGTGLLRFDQHGNLIASSNSTISVQRTDVASVSPLDFEFNMNLDALAALATNQPEVTQTYQDGAGAGTLFDYSIISDGTIVGYFDSGVERTIGQIPLATFRNQEGLYKSGDSLYQQSANSGQPSIRTAGTSGAGTIKSRTLELSNTDIGQEIVDMILSSNMYRANAKVMTTSNEMYDTLMMIR